MQKFKNCESQEKKKKVNIELEFFLKKPLRLKNNENKV